MGVNEVDNSMLLIEKILFLRGVPLFQEVPDEAITTLAGCTEEMEVSEGEEIIKEGEVDNTMYILVSGKAEVTSQGKHIAFLGPNDYVGELAVFSPKERSATVTCKEWGAMLKLTQDNLMHYVGSNPSFLKSVIVGLCHKIRETNVKMIDGSIKK
jgi:CRP/FNR family transcriptional regulator, cyclic AMP receptor protein